MIASLSLTLNTKALMTLCLHTSETKDPGNTRHKKFTEYWITRLEHKEKLIPLENGLNTLEFHSRQVRPLILLWKNRTIWIWGIGSYSALGILTSVRNDFQGKDLIGLLFESVKSWGGTGSHWRTWYSPSYTQWFARLDKIASLESTVFYQQQ